MGWKRLLVLTFKPAVQSAWETDLRTHVDFEGWQFISHDNEPTYETADRSRPIVCFGSFQDYLGRTKAGGIKARNEWVHTINWDCVILDEYYFGAWRENTKELFENEDRREQTFAEGGELDYFDEELMPITTGEPISICRKRRSGHCIRVSLSRSRFLRGPTPTSSA